MTDTFILGTHLSTARGLARMGKDALSIGANTLQFFLRNPRGFKARALDVADMEALRTLLAAHRFGKIMAHAPYILNPCSPDPHLRQLGTQILAEDLARMARLPGNLYVLHPGSHVGQGADAAVGRVADMLNEVLQPGGQTTVLLETMAGGGTEVGGNFRELGAIFDRLDAGLDVGVCFDSCHLFAAGYDIVNELDGVLAEFDRSVGLSRLRAFHLNDSKMPFASHKDRHAPLGDGFIGLDALAAIVNHPRLRHLPFVTETPLDLAEHEKEIRRLRALRE